MKRLISLSLMATALLIAGSCEAQQDKTKRKSPPATISRTINSGATITINYSQPSLNGRTVGEDVEPMPGKIWRMGANEATTFETDKAITVNGQSLPAGKYSLFGLQGENDFKLIFNKEWKIWGTQYEANKEKDALEVSAKSSKSDRVQERLTYTIDKDGTVKLLWGDQVIQFQVQ